jgi:hypothetical protein
MELDGRKTVKFPVFSRGTGNLALETGSLETGPSAILSLRLPCFIHDPFNSSLTAGRSGALWTDRGHAISLHDRYMTDTDPLRASC